MRLSVVVPALDEAAGVERCLAPLQALRARGHEVIVVDGGSADATASLARPLADQVIAAPRGRAVQMNAGARAATGEAFMFLHADTRVPEGGDEIVLKTLENHSWGRFDVRIEGAHILFPLIALFINLRSRLSGIATGDQAIFVRRDAFAGFPEIPLMEDVAFSKAMRRRGPPACLRERVVTSGRRWEKRGVLRTVVLMWRLRAAYALGADPARLAERYK